MPQYILTSVNNKGYTNILNFALKMLHIAKYPQKPPFLSMLEISFMRMLQKISDIDIQKNSSWLN